MATRFQNVLSRFGDNSGEPVDRGLEDSATDSGPDEVTYGNLTYIHEKGGNNSLPSYQEATGAPVEQHSPLGYGVGPVTIIFLNVSMMIGTGVFSTREYKYPQTLHLLELRKRHSMSVISI